MMAVDATAAAPWRVLIVDDEENLNWSLVASLRKDGYIVDGAHTGEEALARLHAAPYDCVVSDIKMPGMDGFELLQWMRQNRPATRMVMITSFGSPSARQDALREGAVAFFEKPFDLRALKDQLRRMAEAPATLSPPDVGYDLLDVAQVINLARRDIALDVRGGGYTGMLRFLQGELLWAEAGDLRGDEAFLALCVPRGGHAQMAAWNGGRERNVTQPVARLIYTALARREGRTGAPARSPAEPRAASTAAPAPLASSFVPADDLATGATAAYPTADVGNVASDPPVMAGGEAPAANLPGALAPASPADHPPMPAPSLPAARAGEPVETTAALEALAAALPIPSGVMWLGTDAGLLWQRWRGEPEMAREALAPLHTAVRAAGQALALSRLGVLSELRIVTAERQIILRRGPGGGTLLLSLAPDADAGAVAEALQATVGATAG